MRLRHTAALVLLASWGLVCLCLSPAPATSPSGPLHPSRVLRRPGHRVLLVALPPATWRDLRSANLPNLTAFMQDSAIGLMPAPAASDPDRDRIWATLGSGRAAVAIPDLPQPAPASRGLSIDLVHLRQANVRAHTGAQPGLLATGLHRAARPAAVVSTADDARGPLLALADESGLLDGAYLGRTGRDLRPAVAEAVSRHAVVLVDLTSAPSLEAADAHLRDALAALSPDYSSCVFVFSPITPAQSDPANRALAPVLVKRFAPLPDSGLLTTPTTRTPGLIAPADIAPTILNWWVVPSGRSMNGRPIAALPADDALARLDRLDAGLTGAWRLRFSAARIYLPFAFAVIVPAALLALWRPRLLRPFAALGLAVPLAPIGILLAPLFGLEPTWFHLVVAALITAVLARLAANLGRPAAGIAVAMLLGAALITLDILLGSPLMRSSAFGFNPITGSRFYGVGNEYMGLLAGMAAVGLGALLHLSPRAARCLPMLALVAVLAVGYPRWGANWGGSFALAAGLVALWLLVRRRRPIPILLLAAAALAAAALAPAAFDLLQPPIARSHIGAGAAALLAGHTDSVLDIARRKLAINLRVIQEAPWTLLALTLAVGALWALLRRAGPARQALRGRRPLAAGIAAALIAAFVATVVNDSGLVAGAGGILATVASAIFLAARPQEQAS